MNDPCPKCGEAGYRRLVSMLHACPSCEYIAQGLPDAKEEVTDPLVKLLVRSIFDTPTHHKMIADEAKASGIDIRMAEPIAETSWLNDPKFDTAWFKAGYAYAATQTKAIYALSATRPEDLYFAVTSILRGARKAGPIPEF